MKLPVFPRRTLTLILFLGLLLGLFIYVGWRTGPLATTAVTGTPTEVRTLSPELFGIGVVQARFTYKIGPIYAGRVSRLDVHVGDAVKAGQVLGEMDAVDLGDRIRAQEAAMKGAEAFLRQAEAKKNYARSQMERYEQLLASHTTSEEIVSLKRQEWEIARTAYESAQEEVARIQADWEALLALRDNLKLISPVDGLVVSRDVEPGTTVGAGQEVIEMIDPQSLWVEARFDQIHAEGLCAGLPAKIVLRSRRGQSFSGRVLRVEPRADAITEETLAKIVFDTPLIPLPPLGELAEVTVQLPALPPAPTLPNGAIHMLHGQRGAWKISGAHLEFIPLTLGRSDLNGYIQIHNTLPPGDLYVLYSEKPLSGGSRVHSVHTVKEILP